MMSRLPLSFCSPRFKLTPAIPKLRTYVPSAFFSASESIQKLRNIGISAHIDSGKTTLTERILFYSGRINEIHEVKGKDGVGAKMDSMDLEREKGITIQSAATYIGWRDYHINIIDTPGHVDFTIEVERSLRVLDGAVLVICGVGGVQSQTFTVDKQMRRYKVPRIVFINKLDRGGADPERALKQLKDRLGLNCESLQIPIGMEETFEGVVDIIEQKAYIFDGYKGSKLSEKPVPDALVSQMNQKRKLLIESLALTDDEFGEIIIAEGREPTVAEIKGAVRRSTIANKFIPVFMGSAYKNKGVQILLDAVLDYLPNPAEVENYGLDTANNEAKVLLKSDSKLPFVGLAFKLEENKFGQLTYMRVYQGTLRRGDNIKNVKTKKTMKVPRLVRMHSNEMEEVQEIGAGEICAMFGVECSSGDSFCSTEAPTVAMTSMYIPEPVMSYAVTVNSKTATTNFFKALHKFQREDPTFRVHTDTESGETIISGMGELHLEIYLERLKREYGVETNASKPRVAFRETIQQRAEFSYLHKKQSGGSGQYAKVCGYMEPIPLDEGSAVPKNEFVNELVGGAIPPQFMPAIQKGFEESVVKGPMIGNPITGVRFAVNDGAFHAVDSNEIAFRTAAKYAFSLGFKNSSPVLLEPVMKMEVTFPADAQAQIIGIINKRKGMVLTAEMATQSFMTIYAEVPLNNMFGFSTELRSLTQGKGEFSMEYCRHAIVTRDVQEALCREHAAKVEAAQKK